MDRFWLPLLPNYFLSYRQAPCALAAVIECKSNYLLFTFVFLFFFVSSLCLILLSRYKYKGAPAQQFNFFSE